MSIVIYAMKDIEIRKKTCQIWFKENFTYHENSFLWLDDIFILLIWDWAFVLQNLHIYMLCIWYINETIATIRIKWEL